MILFKLQTMVLCNENDTTHMFLKGEVGFGILAGLLFEGLETLIKDHNKKPLLADYMYLQVVI